MKKMMILSLVICTFIYGCDTNTGQKLINLEKKIDIAKGDLGLYADRLEICEDSINSISQKLEAVESYYNNFLKRKGEAPPNTQNSALSVQDIQTALKNAGYYTGSIDGKIGPKMETAIKDFQKANGLDVDGIAGAKTQNLLIKHLGQETD